MASHISTFGYIFTVIVLATFLNSAAAQTEHVVGESLGWLVPPGGPIAYSTWAATKTFRVGDVLEFNFTNGRHNVVEVTKEGFDSCNGSSTIGSIMSKSPAKVLLTSKGEHYYICTFDKHCSLGQKLAVNVTAGFSPAPATAPAPSRGPVTYTVLDTLGWTIPPAGDVAYRTWAFTKTFLVGDTLVFNFTSGLHDVAEVTKSGFDSCNGSSTIGSIITNGPARITLQSKGSHYFICTFSQHCPFGQKLAINVTGTVSTTTPPSSTATPPSITATPPPSSTPSPQPSTATPPSSTATPPSSTATPPPSSTPSPQPSTATPPSSATTPPSSTTAPPPSTTLSPAGSQSPTAGGDTPSTTNTAPSHVVAGFSLTFMYIFIAFLY